MGRMAERVGLCLSMIAWGLAGYGQPVARESERDYQPVTARQIPQKQHIDSAAAPPTAVVGIREDVLPSERSYRPITPRHMPQKQEVDFPTAAPTAIVEIAGNIPAVDFSTWQSTGVCLRTGDVLYIRATGQINYVNDLTVGPDGRGDTFYPSLLPEVSFMALIGRTHFDLLDDDADSSDLGLYGPGFVGSEFKQVYEGRGGHGLTGDNVLYLAVNDSMDNDNGLSLTVHIWVVRDGEVLDAESVRTPPAANAASRPAANRRL